MGRWFGIVVMLLMPAGALTFAGCTEACVSGPPVSARHILSAGTLAGDGDHALDIHVLDGPGGAPLAGAGVVVYWGKEEASDWNGPRAEVSATPGGAYVVADPGSDPRTVESANTLTLMTGADGVARAQVPPNRIVGIVAAKDGFTEEWVPALATGDANGAGAVAVPLFRNRVVIDMDAVWEGPGAGSPGTVTNGDYAWNPQVVPFGDADANRAYAARIIEMTVTINWSNEPTGFGDLGVGVGHEGEGPVFFRDEDGDATPGARTQTATLSLEDLMERGILGAALVRAGAATDSGFVAPFGLPYTMHIDARFDREVAERATACGSVRGGGSDNDTPGFEALMLLAACAVGAAVVRGARRA